MKIILDNDGTLTDFNQFIDDNAIEYFKNKYGMEIINDNELEIEDIFEMKNFFINSGYSEEEAEKKTKEALDDFWISPRFIKFSLLNKFRPGVKEFVNKMIKEGHEVEIHTSRAKTCDDNLIGKISRDFTILQYRINGIFLPRSNFKFYKNDYEKINGIISSNPTIVFDDKPFIIEALKKHQIPTIFVDGKHNKEVSDTETTLRIYNFEDKTIEEKLEKTLGIKNLKYYRRAASSDVFFNKLKLCSPLILSQFKPIILHEENIIQEDGSGIIYAPNHRSTLDPMVITSILCKNIHWAALLRFFKGTDSIFNNSKNPILCKITSASFKKLEYFPIDRKSDNIEANNFDSIRDMNNFLKIKQPIGIFAEGTTRRPEGQDFGTFDDAFLLLAKRNDSWIQPITSLWIKDLNIDSKVIINFGKPFKVKNMPIETAMSNFLEIQKNNLKENEEVKDEISNKIKVKKRL